MSNRRLIDRRIQCQAIDDDTHRRCNQIATGYVRLPARVYVCPEHRYQWDWNQNLRPTNERKRVPHATTN